MEEPHTLQTQNPEPPKPEGVNSETLPQTQNPDSPKPEVAEEAAAPQSQIKKRKLDNGVFHSSSYFKIRAIIKNLRPFFLEVIHAPDFRESKAAHEIRKQMKIMIELSKQLRNETTSTVEPKKLREEPPLAEANEEQVGHHQEGENHAAQPRNGEVTSLSDGVTEKVPQSDKSLNVPDKILGTTAKEKTLEVKEFAKQLEEGFQGIYVIGGSPIGWNFLVYPGSKPVYYGEAKASFLSRQAAKSRPASAIGDAHRSFDVAPVGSLALSGSKRLILVGSPLCVGGWSCCRLVEVDYFELKLYGIRTSASC